MKIGRDSKRDVDRWGQSEFGTASARIGVVREAGSLGRKGDYTGRKERRGLKGAELVANLAVVIYKPR